MTRIKTTLALLLGLVTLAAVAPAAASAANEPNPLRHSLPTIIKVKSGAVRHAAEPGGIRWGFLPERRAKVFLPNPSGCGPGCLHVL